MIIVKVTDGTSCIELSQECFHPYSCVLRICLN